MISQLGKEIHVGIALGAAFLFLSKLAVRAIVNAVRVIANTARVTIRTMDNLADSRHQ